MAATGAASPGPASRIIACLHSDPSLAPSTSSIKTIQAINPIDDIDGRIRAVDRAQLSAFDRIAREGSFSRAALAIGIGQPAISARIHALEAAVGGALFTRGRRIALTPMGEGFLPAARRALQVLDEGLATARLAQSGRRGRVRLTQAAGTPVDVMMEAARRMVLERVGAAFFTRTYIGEDLAAGRLKEIRVRKMAPLHRDSALVRLGRTVPLSPAALHLVDLIR